MTEKPVMLAGVIQNSIVDGPGIRMTVFTQGCPHHCPGCHNPQTHPLKGESPPRWSSSSSGCRETL